MMSKTRTLTTLLVVPCFGAALVLGDDGGIPAAQANDGHVTVASSCQLWGGDADNIVDLRTSSAGRIFNTSTVESVSAVCPMARDTMGNSNGLAEARIWGENLGPVSMSCSVNSTTMFAGGGAVMDSQSQSWTPGASGPRTYFNVDQSHEVGLNGASFLASSYHAFCSIPRNDGGGVSSLGLIHWVED